MRKILLSLLVLVLLPCLLAPALAETAQVNELTGYEAVIDDPAGLLSGSEVSGVFESMLPVTDYANAGFLTCAASGFDSSTAKDKAEKWGDARFGRSSAYTVFIIDMKTRRIAIYSSRSVYGLLTTAKANTITDNVYKLASRADYAGCAREAFSQMARVMQGQAIAQPMKYASNIFLAVICAILITYMFIAGRMRTEQATTIQTLTKAAGIGVATAVTGHVLKKVVHHQSSSGGRGGFGGGGGGFGGGGGGGGGSHGF